MNAPWRNAPPPKARAPRKPKAPTGPLEWQLQAWFVNELHKLEKEGWPLTCAGDMNAGKRGRGAAALAKLTGLTAGEPDVRIYFKGGRIKLVEIKRAKGIVSEAQRNRHLDLARLGFHVQTLWLIDETDARFHAAAIARDFLPLGPHQP